MTAVDQAGRQVARYRIADRRAIEITTHPDQQLTDELILTLALTARWVSSFFDSPGGRLTSAHALALPRVPLVAVLIHVGRRSVARSLPSGALS